MPFPYRGVLFLCRGNAVRSQMAEGIFRSLAPKKVEVWSAGGVPIGLDGRTVEVMGEIGIDISGYASKSVDQIPIEKVDLVITLCGGPDDPCPDFPGTAEIRQWPSPDPFMSPPQGPDGLDLFRQVRDELKKRITKLLKENDSQKKQTNTS